MNPHLSYTLEFVHGKEECVEKAGVTDEAAAYMGDDLPNIPLARRAGLAISVADGADELKAVCHYITQRLVGRSAARAVTEPILRRNGGGKRRRLARVRRVEPGRGFRGPRGEQRQQLRIRRSAIPYAGYADRCSDCKIRWHDAPSGSIISVQRGSLWFEHLA